MIVRITTAFIFLFLRSILLIVSSTGNFWHKISISMIEPSNAAIKSGDLVLSDNSNLLMFLKYGFTQLRYIFIISKCWRRYFIVKILLFFNSLNVAFFQSK